MFKIGLKIGLVKYTIKFYILGKEKIKFTLFLHCANRLFIKKKHFLKLGLKYDVYLL